MHHKRGIGSEFGLGRIGGYTHQRRRTDHLLHSEVLVSSGRAALAAVAGDQHSSTILLPAYVCEAVLQPFIARGWHLRFYPVDSHLRVDVAALLASIGNSQVDAVLLVHYFGFPQPDGLIDAIRAARPDITIIDDRTHSLLTDLQVSYTGGEEHITVYSVRKWGPFPDLGVVIGSSELPDHTDSRFAALRIWALLLRQLFVTLPVNGLRQASRAAVLRAESAIDQHAQNSHASLVSRWLWHHWDWQAAYQARRANFQYLLENWPFGALEPLYKVLPDGVCPLGFPVYTPSRDAVRQRFINASIYPPIHWHLPREVSASEFPDAAQLSAQELTLPIDQRYGRREMDSILEMAWRV